MKTLLFPAALVVLASFPARARAIQPVPDGTGGLVRTLQVTAPPQPLAELRVTLDLSGPDGFVGDLYATLQHESGAFAVLLNRPGRDAGLPEGYGDHGLRLTFDLYGPDIHTYRDTLGGPPADGLLTGTWSADGRTADPAEVVTGSPRPALLNSFVGLEPGGEWILFVADVNPGGQVFLNHWDLDFTPVPEPSQSALLVGSLGVAFVLLRRRRSRGERPPCHRSHRLPGRQSLSRSAPAATWAAVPPLAGSRRRRNPADDRRRAIVRPVRPRASRWPRDRPAYFPTAARARRATAQGERAGAGRDKG